MKASDVVKKTGLKDMNEFVELSGESIQNLYNWHKNKELRFTLMLLGAVTIKNKQESIKPNISFDDWFDQLDELAIKEGFMNERNSEVSKKYWENFYHINLTPEQAFYKVL